MGAVVVTRCTVHGSCSQEFVDLLEHLNAKALHYPGYVSAETIASSRNGVSDIVLISRWRNRGNWHDWEQNWKRDGERDALEARMAALLVAPPVSMVYTDSPFAVPADV